MMALVIAVGIVRLIAMSRRAKAVLGVSDRTPCRDGSAICTLLDPQVLS